MTEIPLLFKTICLNILRATNFPAARGRPRIIEREEILNEIWNILRGGMQWRMLKPISCSWKTVFYYFTQWTKQNLFKNAYQHLLKIRQKTRRDAYHIIDSTYIKNVYGIDCIGRNPSDRGRNATKMSALVNDEGIPISVVFVKGNKNDVITLQETLDAVLVPKIKDKIPFMGDKGYPSKKNSQIVTNAGYLDRISRRKHKVGRRQNKKRCTVEHTFSWIDKYRRLIMRFDKKITAFEAFTFIALSSILSQRILK